jgi:Flp pilus assembly protein TadG
MKRLNDESGQALIITALCMTILFGFIALAADAGIMLREKRMAQTAADGAAVAGASELAFPAQVSSAAKAASALNGFSDGVNGVTVTVNGPTAGGPAYGPHAGNPKYVEVIVSQVQPTFFMKFFGVLNMTPTARAVATQGVTNGCIVTLGTDPTVPGISVIGAADITVATCGIADDSPNPAGDHNAGLYLQGNATLTANSIGVAGGYQSTGGSVNLPGATPSTGMIPVSDPLAATVGTPPATTPCSNVPANATTLPPGCWNGISVGNNKTLTLSGSTANADGTVNTGQYVINGPLNLGGGATLTGTGVQLVLYGTTSMGGNTNLNLTGSAAYNNVVIWEPASNTSPLNLVGTPSSDIEGIVYAPAAPLSLQGHAGAIIRVNFVVSSLTLQGDATLLDYNQVNPNNIMTVARLVE